MKKQVSLFLVCVAIMGSWAEGIPNLIIRYESYKHVWDKGTKIWHAEIQANGVGIIDRIDHYLESEPETRDVAEFKRSGNRITWTNHKLPHDLLAGEIILSEGSFILRTLWNNQGKMDRKSWRQNRIIIGNKGNILWEDDEKTVFLDPDGTYREIAKKPDPHYKLTPAYIIIASNEMLRWQKGRINLRAIFSREGDRTMTEHLQGRDDAGWDELGWASVEGLGLRSADPMVTAINAYILKQYFNLPVYLPHLLGLKTGTL